MMSEPTAEERVAQEAAESYPSEGGLRRRDRHAFDGDTPGVPGSAATSSARGFGGSKGDGDVDVGADGQSFALPMASAVRQPARRGTATVGEKQRRARRRRWTVWGCVAFAMLVLGYYAVSLLQVYSAGKSNDARPVDAIVVMGAAQYDGRPSPQLAARLDRVVELWSEGLAPLVVVTGGKQPGDRFTEAEASAAYLIERGIAESAIVREDQGTTSFQSLERVSALLNVESTDGATVTGATVLIVTDPYHTLRSTLIAREVGLTAYGSPTQTSVVTGGRSFERHVVEAGGVAVGRLTGFGWLSGLTD